jgi:hypothetical protein
MKWSGNVVRLGREQRVLIGNPEGKRHFSTCYCERERHRGIRVGWWIRQTLHVDMRAIGVGYENSNLE